MSTSGASTPPTDPAAQSTAALLNDLSRQTSRLVRDEIRLAQKELQLSARHAGRGAGMAGVASLLAVLGLGTAVASVVAALSLVLAVWLSAAIVAAVLLVLAGVAAVLGRRHMKEITAPAEESIDSVKRDVEVIKEANA